MSQKMEKPKRSRTNKRKLLGISGGILVVLTAVAAFFLLNQPKIKLIEPKTQVEYGEVISSNAKDYVSADADVVAQSVVIFEIPNEEGKEYAAVGVYPAKIVYDKTVLDFEIVVSDTIAPEFQALRTEINVQKNAEDIDYAQYFAATDLTDVIVVAESDAVDLGVVGDYELTVVATDAFDNKTSAVVQVHIIEGREGLTSYIDGFTPTNAETKQQLEEQKRQDQEQKQQQEQAVPEQNPYAPGGSQYHGPGGPNYRGGNKGPGGGCGIGYHPGRGGECVKNGRQ